MKTCSKCGVEKELGGFNNDCSSTDGLYIWCRSCFNSYKRAWRKEHPISDSKARRKHYKKNAERYREYTKQYNKDNPEKIKVSARNWRIKNPHYDRERRKVDVAFRIRESLKSRFWMAIKNHVRTGSAVRDLGCSIDGFKLYIENQFKTGMAWENYGTVWEYDHVIPLSCYDLTNRMEVQEACNWLNIQPMFCHENRSKKDTCYGY